MSTTSRHTQFEVLRTALDNERSRFLPHWRTLADWILPRRAQFTVSETNNRELRNLEIINNTATMASRTLASGMMSGVTSPARPWKKLTTSDPKLAESGPVKEWLHEVNERMDTVFLRSNLYNALPTLYGDLGTFATGAVLVEEDFDDVVRFQTLPIGSYMLALNDKLEVDVFFREFRLTVRQTVERFGVRGEDGKIDMSNFSISVQGAYDKEQYDTWVDIYHVIQRNKDFNPNSLTSKQYQSVYYEKGTEMSGTSGRTDLPDVFLRDRGYDRFPVLAPRWSVTGEDVYGSNCPGMTALGDIKALQVLEKRKAQAVDKMVNPPLMGSPELKQSKVSILPGDITYVPMQQGGRGLEPVFQVNFDINSVAAEIREHEERIRRAYFEDLFLMLATTDRRQITATEIDARREEKLLALGPVLEQLNQDLLDPLIDLTFDIMDRQGLIPPAPEELQGMPLKVEYISIMHQAQKLAGLAGIERLTQFVGEVASFKPEALDKLDVDQLIDEYAKVIGTPPNLIRPDDMVEAIREVRMQAEEAARQAEQLSATAGAARDLAGADMEGNNALTELMQRSQAGALQ